MTVPDTANYRDDSVGRETRHGVSHLGANGVSTLQLHSLLSQVGERSLVREEIKTIAFEMSPTGAFPSKI